MPPLIANARMYAVTPAVEASWQELFDWVAAASGVPLAYLLHPAPAPLEDLWARDDLGAAFMCGLPFSRAAPQPIAVAAPAPSPPRYGGRARYCSDLVVRADSAFATLADAFGHRIGWTVEHSQSGYAAVCRHLAGCAASGADAEFSSWVGPLHTPRRVIDALLAGTIEVGPVDSYVHDLLRVHEPATARQLRVVASTAFTPNPLLVAAAVAPPDAVTALRRALLGVAAEPMLASLRAALLIDGFVPVLPGDYAPLKDAAGRIKT